MSNSYDPMDYSPPVSSIHGILQTRILERVSKSLFRGSSWPRDQTQSPALPTETRETPILHVIRSFSKSIQSLSWVQLFATPGTVARQASLSMGILQARILKWLPFPSPGPPQESNPGLLHCRQILYWATREAPICSLNSHCFRYKLLLYFQNLQNTEVL